MTTIDHEAFFIDGAWRPAQSDDRFDVISPRSEQIIGHVPAASTRRHRRRGRRRPSGLRRGGVAPADPGRAGRLPDPHGRRDRQAPGRARRADHRGARLHALPLAGLPGRVPDDEPQLQRRDRPQPRHRAGAAQRPRPAGRRAPRAAASSRWPAPAWSSRSRSAWSRRSRRTTSRFPAVPQKVAPALIAGCTVGRQGHRAQPAGDVRLRRDLRGDRPAAGRPQHRRGARHRSRSTSCATPVSTWSASPARSQTGARIAAACGELIRALRAGARREVRGDRARGRANCEDVLPVLVGASVGTNAGQSCVALTRLVVPGRAVRRLRRGARRALPVAEDRRPDGGRHRRSARW